MVEMKTIRALQKSVVAGGERKREKGGKGRGGRCGRRWRWLRFFGLAQFHYLQLAKGKPGPGQTLRVKQQKSNMEKKAN